VGGKKNSSLINQAWVHKGREKKGTETTGLKWKDGKSPIKLVTGIWGGGRKIGKNGRKGWKDQKRGRY